MAAERDISLDAARGAGILLVICGHVLEPAFLDRCHINDGLAFRIWQVIYAFHMPFFFLVAGATDRLMADRPLRARLAAALKLVPTAMAFSLLGFIPQVVGGRLTSGEVLVKLCLGAEFGLAPLWFLAVLALARIVYEAAASTSSRCRFWGLLALVLLISGACAAFRFKLWHGQALFGALPFYVLGRLRGVEGRAISVSAALCGLMTLLVFAPTNLVHLADGRYGDPATFAACAAGGCCCVSALVGRLGGPVLAAAARLGTVSFELFIVTGIALAATPVMRRLDDGPGLLLLLAACGLPLQLVLAAALRRPILALRRGAEAPVDLWLRRREPTVSA